jgi:hypothetical protein
LFFILAFWPRPQHTQIVAKLMEVARRRAVTHFELKLLFEQPWILTPVQWLASLARFL